MDKNENKLTIDENASIQVTLNAGDWSTILRSLDEIPRKMSDRPYNLIVQALTNSVTPPKGKAVKLPKAPRKGSGEKKK